MMQSLLSKIVRTPLDMNIQTCSILNAFVRNHSIWNKDWKPGPIPLTKEEKEAAALKYGLAPSEYQAYDDDGSGHGDYPKLPDISVESKDPYYPWDFPEHKRNLHDTLHVEMDMYGEDRVYINQRFRIPFRQQVSSFFIVMTVFYVIYEVLDVMPMFRPVKAKQYPECGKTHYTFELE